MALNDIHAYIILFSNHFALQHHPRRSGCVSDLSVDQWLLRQLDVEMKLEDTRKWTHVGTETTLLAMFRKG